MSIPKTDWAWYGCAGHLIVGNQCRFHLCTQVGAYLISTVGWYFPPKAVRESAGGDKKGPMEIGCDRIGETFVFNILDGKETCGCPIIAFSEIGTTYYSDEEVGKNCLVMKEGHEAMCEKYARMEHSEVAP